MEYSLFISCDKRKENVATGFQRGQGGEGMMDSQTKFLAQLSNRLLMFGL
jgi:hypothetical protein